MKKLISLLLLLNLFLVLAISTQAVVWDKSGFQWLSSDDPDAAIDPDGKLIIIHEGYTATLGTGDFYSQDDYVHVLVELNSESDPDYTFTVVYDQDVEAISETGYKILVAPTQYGVGNYLVRIVLTDKGEKDEYGYLTLHVVEKINNPPIADFKYEPENPAVGQSVLFTSVSTDEDNDILTHYWDFDGDSIIDSTGISATYIFMEEGDYNIELRVNDGTEESTVFKSIKVTKLNHKPVADFTFSPIAPKTGEEVSFSATVSDEDNEPLTYEWDFDNNNVVDSIELNPKYTYTTAGIYNIVFKVSDGKDTATVIKVINVQQKPEGDLKVTEITGSEKVFVGNEQTIFVEVRDNNNQPIKDAAVKVFYQSETKDKNLFALLFKIFLKSMPIAECNTDADGKCPVHYTENYVGKKTVYAVAEKEGYNPDLSKSKTFSYLVLLSEMHTQIIADKTNGVAPLTVMFDHATTGAYGKLNFEWYFDSGGGKDNPESVDEKPTHTYLMPGVYTVKLTVTDSIGNTASDTLQITVESDILTKAVINVDVTEGYAPLDVHFSGEGSSGNGELIYEWDLNGDGTIDSTSPSTTYTYTEEEEYTVTLKVTDSDGDTDMASLKITAKGPKTQNTPSKMIGWTEFNLLNGEVYMPGEQMPVLVNFKNKGNWDMKKVKISAYIPDLAVYKSIGPFKLDEGNEITKVIYLDIPEDAQPSVYDIRVDIDADKLHRTKYRSFTVE